MKVVAKRILVIFQRLFFHYLLFHWTVSLMANRAEVQFTVVDSNIDFQHQSGTTGNFHLPETIGAGLAWLDYDLDGVLDLYWVDSGYWPDSKQRLATSKLYRNLGDGTFTDVTQQARIQSTE